MIGESLASLFIVDTLLNDPALFTKYAAISSSLWWDDLNLVTPASDQLQNFPSGERQLYLTMGNEGGNMQGGLDVLIAALESDAPEGLKWSYVDRRNVEEHGSIYHPAALDALRTFYLTPHRTGVSLKAFYHFPNGEVPELSKRAQENIKLPCTHANAIITTFEETNADWENWNDMCVLMKPGAKPTKGN